MITPFLGVAYFSTNYIGALAMALWYTIKIERLKVAGVEVKIPQDSHERQLCFFPAHIEKNKSPYELKVIYFSGKKILKRGVFGKKEALEELRVDRSYSFNDVEVEIISPPEKGRNAKNLGVGAVVGAVAAGPLGAAAGAWVGAKIKNVEVKVNIRNGEFTLLGKVSSGFVAALEKASTSSKLRDVF